MDTTTLSDVLIECLSAKKDELKLTNAAIAEKSGVPESTVTKLFNRTIKSPTFDTLAPVAKVLNVSLDALLEMDNADIQKSPPPPSIIENPMFKMLIDNYTKQLLAKNRWITVLAAALFVLFAAMIFFVIYDVSHPNLGWVQYTVQFKNMVSNLVDMVKI